MEASVPGRSKARHVVFAGRLTRPDGDAAAILTDTTVAKTSSHAHKQYKQALTLPDKRGVLNFIAQTILRNSHQISTGTYHLMDWRKPCCYVYIPGKSVAKLSQFIVISQCGFKSNDAYRELPAAEYSLQGFLLFPLCSRERFISAQSRRSPFPLGDLRIATNDSEAPFNLSCYLVH
jgi:hypothetical protein